ncbi:MAG: BCCT family transporter, partial [Verrucomicrobiota bacterium]
LPLTIRSCLYPFIGRRIHGWMGNVVDVVAVCGTMFGVATSLGLGVGQINAGLDYLGVLPIGIGNQMFLIAGITGVATVSVVLGLNVGIKRLSEFAIIAAGVLLLLVFIAGPTEFVIASFVQNIGDYAQNLFRLSFNTDAFKAAATEDGLAWQKGWTMFYWGWWISWSPFVGMFLARISRGRTIREFVAAVLFIPTAVTFFWLTVFGETALHRELFGAGGMVEALGAPNGYYTTLFEMLHGLPLATVSSWLAVLAIFAFFVTSSDSGSLVIDIITSGGNEDPPVGQRIFWAVTEGVVAAVLLFIGTTAVASGGDASAGLRALQTAAITTALPFCAIIVLVCFGLMRSFRSEHRALSETAHRTEDEVIPSLAPASETVGGKASDTEPHEVWRDRLADLTVAAERPNKERSSLDDAWESIERFLGETAEPALREIQKELEARGRKVEIEREKHSRILRSHRGGKERFEFRIEGHAFKPLSFAPVTDGARSLRGKRKTAAAEAVIRTGHGRLYPLRNWSREGLIDSFLREYSRWVNW